MSKTNKNQGYSTQRPTTMRFGKYLMLYIFIKLFNPPLNL